MINALVIASDTYRNGTGCVAVSAPARLAETVGPLLVQLGADEGCGPISRRDTDGRMAWWLLRCRAEDATRLRTAVVVALAEVRP